MNRKSCERLRIAGLLVCLAPASVAAQSFERDISVTGPRGRTLERKTEIQRGPGGVERNIQINRPSGTYSRQVDVHRSPGFAPGRPMMGPGLRFVPFGPPPPSGPSAGALVGLGVGLAALPAIGFAAGVASRPPVVVSPAPLVAAPAVVAAPVVPAPSPNAVDPVNLAAQKLYSNYFGTRRDGAIELGRLGDPRGVPALTHVLKYDNFEKVRIAAARALGEIGGPEAATVLERCIVYEKRQAVRDVATVALHHLRAREAQAAVAGPSTISSNVSTVPKLSTRTDAAPRRSSGNNQGWIPSTSNRSTSTVESGPSIEGPDGEEPNSSVGDRTPPPPPTPVSP